MSANPTPINARFDRATVLQSAIINLQFLEEFDVPGASPIMRENCRLSREDLEKIKQRAPGLYAEALEIVTQEKLAREQKRQTLLADPTSCSSCHGTGKVSWSNCGRCSCPAGDLARSPRVR